jgi:hypothetical protein
MESTEENIDLRHDQLTEKAELDEKLKLEKQKVFMLDNDIESHASKLRRLIMDVFKKQDSPIALKDRIKLNGEPKPSYK